MDLAGADGIDADLVGSIVTGEILRECRNRCFCGVVGDVVRSRIKAPLRCDVDDRAAARFDHMRDRGAANMEHRIEVDGEARVPVLVGQRHEVADFMRENYTTLGRRKAAE